MTQLLRHRLSGMSFPSVVLFLMMAGLLFSRALLSLIHPVLLIWIMVEGRKKAFPTGSLIGWSLFALALPLLGCWQTPFTGKHFDLPLTWLMYPIAFYCVALLNEKNIRQLIQWCQVAAIAGILYALISYLFTLSDWNRAYGTGQSLPTFMDSDHVRFGLFLCGTGLLTWLSDGLSKQTKFIYLLILLIAILIMAVRSAWVGAIIILLTCTFYSGNENHWFRIRQMFLILFFILLAIGAGYLLFPTIQQKWAYMVYDWQQFDQSADRLGYSDGARRLINSLAWETIEKNKWPGVGWGNISSVMEINFLEKFPEQKLSFSWPFNQWLFWWLGAGISGLLLFSAWLLFPLFQGIQQKNTGIIAWTLVIAASCWVESTLSFQFGVWLHAWIGALAWRVSMTNKTSVPIRE